MENLVQRVAEAIRKEFYRGGPSFGEPEAKAAINSVVIWMKDQIDNSGNLNIIELIETELEKENRND